jgi:hypothetical protein
VENVRWRQSPRLRPLSPETIEEALHDVDVDPGWRKPIPTRGYGQAVYDAIVKLVEGLERNPTEREVADEAGCSRASVSRWKRWLRQHRWITWVHARKLGEKWARCVYVTRITRPWCEDVCGSDALTVVTSRSRARGAASLAHRAELLLQEALSRARVGTRNTTCYVMGRLLKKIGVDPGLAVELGCRFAARVPQPGSFSEAEAMKCIGSAYKLRRLTLVPPVAQSESQSLAA